MKEKDLSEIIKNMKRANNSSSFDVWVPSLKKNISFLEINTSQQKRLLKSIIDSPIYNTQFIKTSYQIIKENCSDDIEICNLTILDKFSILLKLRCVSIGNEMEVEFQSKNDENIKYKSKIDLEKIYDSIKSKIVNVDSSSIDLGSFIVDCSVPTLITELKLEEDLRNHDENLEINTPEELRKSIGDKFIGELCKYINSITIKGEESNTYNLGEYNFMERIQIIENLPSKIVDKVLNYMESVNKEIEKVSLIKKFVTINGKKEEVEYQLNLDSTFFTNS